MMKTKSHQVLSGKALVGIELEDQLVPNCYKTQFRVDIVELNSQVQIICPLKYFVNFQLKYVGWLNLNGTTLGTDYLDQTTANVCFSTNLDECGQSVSIQIKNCGDFNLYYLTDTSEVSSYCQYRYCTE